MQRPIVQKIHRTAERDQINTLALWPNLIRCTPRNKQGICRKYTFRSRPHIIERFHKLNSTAALRGLCNFDVFARDFIAQILIQEHLFQIDRARLAALPPLKNSPHIADLQLDVVKIYPSIDKEAGRQESEQAAARRHEIGKETATRLAEKERERRKGTEQFDMFPEGVSRTKPP